MSTAIDTVPTVRTRGGDGWQRAWPLGKSALFVLAKGGVVMLVVWTGVGLLYMKFLDDGPIGDADRAGARWLEDRRTPTLNTLTHYGSMLSETLVKVILIAVVGGAMVIIWRRWHDGVFLAIAVSLEAGVFVITSFIVGRDRPPVTQLDAVPPSGSFPSGHAGAAVAFYAGVFVVVCWHTRNRVVRWAFGVVAVAAPLIVGFSRAERGMHHPLDVAAGLLLGVAAIYVARAAIAAGVDEIDRAAGDTRPPDRVRRLDLTTPDPVVADGPVLPSGVQP
jgi:membrane-associated phospholipid phosphatase